MGATSPGALLTAATEQPKSNMAKVRAAMSEGALAPFRRPA
jgi:hypothetical protein